MDYHRVDLKDSSVLAPGDFTAAGGTDRDATQPPVQALPMPSDPAPALAQPSGPGMQEVVRPLAAAADLSRLGAPDRIVVVGLADERMRDLVQDRVRDLRHRGAQAVADRERDPTFRITASAGTGRSQVEGEYPRTVEAAVRLVQFEQFRGECFDLAKRVFATCPLDHTEAVVSHAQSRRSRLRHDQGAAPLQLGHDAVHRAAIPDEADPAPGWTGRAREVGTHCRHRDPTPQRARRSPRSA